MKKILLSITLLCFLILSKNADAQLDVIEDNPLSNRIANYEITAELDHLAKTIDGKLKLNWKNTSGNVVNELQFHLYMNAFKNSETTFMKESGGNFRGGRAGNLDKEYGEISISSLKVRKGKDISKSIKFIQPDDNNPYDQTVISVQLAEGVAPGETVPVYIDFKTKLPKIIARTGYSNDYFLVGQWFPKIGVYQNGGWNCHQFHAHSEFFADFGSYNVSLIVPSEYKVGATGLKVNTEANDTTGKTTHVYKAEDVIDFAWTCSPHFIEIKSNWKYVDIILLMQPEHVKQAQSQIEALKASFAYFDEHVGRFPYPQITVVNPPFGGLNSGGMEYPGFITVGTIAKKPEKFLLPEITLIHEFGHQYFMGILASNEFEEPWLDEGMNSYLETRIVDDLYKQKDRFFFAMSDKMRQRSTYVQSRNIQTAPSSLSAWEFPSHSYGTMVYAKPATFLNTLERIIGVETMDEILKEYFDKFKFKHPTAKDFIAIVNKQTKKKHKTKFGKNMDWFFDQMLYGTSTCDYSATSIVNSEISSPQGSFNTTDVTPPTSSGNYISKATFSRKGEAIMPVDIAITFDNGRTIRKFWNGQGRIKQYKFKGTGQIVKIEIDPERKLLIDTNFLNNSKIEKQKTSATWKYVLKLLFWLQNFMQTVAFLA